MEFLQNTIFNRPIVPNGKQEYNDASSAMHFYHQYKNHKTDSDILEKAYNRIAESEELYIREYYSGLEIETVTDDEQGIFEFVMVLDGGELEDLLEIFANALPYLENLKHFSYTTRFSGEIDYSCLTFRPEKLKSIELSNLMSVPVGFLDGIESLVIGEYYGNEKIPDSVKDLEIVFWSEMDGLNEDREEENEQSEFSDEMIEQLVTFANQFPNLEYFEVNQTLIPISG